MSKRLRNAIVAAIAAPLALGFAFLQIEPIEAAEKACPKMGSLDPCEERCYGAAEAREERCAAVADKAMRAACYEASNDMLATCIRNCVRLRKCK
jgi:uncharacterized membrane protein